jgi:hypothetical protein
VRVTLKTYLATLPERLVRSAVGLGAGLVREVGEVAVPERMRRSQLYGNVVDATLRYLIEQVGAVEGVYRAEGQLSRDFLARRAAGNLVEAVGVVAFRASPVWVLAALADVCGIGRHLIPEIADALKAQGLLEPGTQFTSVDQLLDGLERTASRLAATVNAPPLDVRALREEWEAIREAARSLQPAALPSPAAIGDLWKQLEGEAARQNRSVFETSSMMALSALRAAPGGLRWLTASTKVGTATAGQVLAAALLEDYRRTLDGIRHTGFVAYGTRQLRPYLHAAAAQFSPARRTLTERLMDRWHVWRGADATVDPLRIGNQSTKVEHGRPPTPPAASPPSTPERRNSKRVGQ